MPSRIVPVFESPLPEAEIPEGSGSALARIADYHPDIPALMDFCHADPLEIARQVGMTSLTDEYDEEDLAEIDFGLGEWYEPQAGLVAVQHALNAIRASPDSIRRAVYDPGLRAEDVITDLEQLEKSLLIAQQHEIRFRFIER